MKTVYTNLYEITEVQQKIVRFVDYWVHVEKTPVPREVILVEMETKNQKRKTVIHALDGLLKLGYLRRAEIISNKTFYVQQKRL